ncbi:hypothetical protein HKD37_10G026985 [Glycine soja]
MKGCATGPTTRALLFPIPTTILPIIIFHPQWENKKQIKFTFTSPSSSSTTTTPFPSTEHVRHFAWRTYRHPLAADLLCFSLQTTHVPIIYVEQGKKEEVVVSVVVLELR